MQARKSERRRERKRETRRKERNDIRGQIGRRMGERALIWIEENEIKYNRNDMRGMTEVSK